jgi:hypothetical protein
VAHWDFDDTGGEFTDDVASLLLTSSDATGIANELGLRGYSARFDGTHYATLLAGARTFATSPSASGFTVAFWFNVAILGGLVPDPNELVSVWDDSNWPSNSSYRIWISAPADTVHVQAMGSVSWGFLEAWRAETTWMHVALTYQPGLWTLYVNGQTGATLAQDCMSCDGALTVGGHTNAVEPGQGAVDELAIWSRCLSAASIARLYNAGSGLAYPYL